MSLLKTKVNKLLLKFKNGNNYAFKDLFDFLYKKLISIARQYLKNKSDADDVVSETFIQIHKSISQFDDLKDGYNWICKIVERKALDKNRKNKVYDELDGNFIDEQNIFEEINNKTDIESEINKLPEDEQKIVRLYFYYGYTYKEIGEVMGYLPQMAYKKMKTILGKLRKIIKF